MQIVRVGGGSKHASIAAFSLHAVLQQIRWGGQPYAGPDGRPNRPKVFYSDLYSGAREVMLLASERLSRCIKALVEQRTRLSLETVLEVADADHVSSGAVGSAAFVIPEVLTNAGWVCTKTQC